MDLIQAVLDNVENVIVIWEWIKSFGGDGGEEEQPESDGEAGGGSSDMGDCLQAASFDASVHMASCDQNGVVWIQVPHNNGSYLINRYEYDHGNTPQVLTVVNDNNGENLILDDEGTGWQNWSWQTFFLPVTRQSRPARAGGS